LTGLDPKTSRSAYRICCRVERASEPDSRRMGAA
jgi:hypothetical protein